MSTRTMFLFFALLATGLSAQTKPNFNGVWKLNETQTAMSPGGPREIVFKIDHKEPVFKYAASGKVGYNQNFSEAYECNTASKSQHDPSKLAVECQWEGDALALRYVKGATELIKFRLRLSADGKQMFREGGKEGKLHEVYDRQ